MATIAPTAAGAAFTPVAAVGPDKYLNHGTEKLYINNGSGAGITVTINSQQPCDQGFDHDGTVSVAAGQTKILAPLSAARYNDVDGYVNITYSSATSVTVGVLAT